MAPPDRGAPVAEVARLAEERGFESLLFSEHGRFVSFVMSRFGPRPVQRPHPPVLVGGNGKTVLSRVLAHGDGWLPNDTGDAAGLLRRVSELRRLALDSGRNVSINIATAPATPATIAAHAAAALDRVMFRLPSGDLGAVEARMDEVLAAARKASLSLT
jgi:alkanesulfonate monooxygenase SsuD/methylene tetrahydromethanopterin reductase-like flavin-dependent oxidoreductase (luciferase family)